MLLWRPLYIPIRPPTLQLGRYSLGLADFDSIQCTHIHHANHLSGWLVMEIMYVLNRLEWSKGDYPLAIRDGNNWEMTGFGRGSNRGQYSTIWNAYVVHAPGARAESSAHWIRWRSTSSFMAENLRLDYGEAQARGIRPMRNGKASSGRRVDHMKMG